MPSLLAAALRWICFCRSSRAMADMSEQISHLALGIIEVCWHGDDCSLDRTVIPDEGLGSLFHLDQHHG